MLGGIIVLNRSELFLQLLLPLFGIDLLMLVDVYAFHQGFLCLLLVVQDLPLPSNLRQDYIFLELLLQLFIRISVALYRLDTLQLTPCLRRFDLVVLFALGPSFLSS